MERYDIRVNVWGDVSGPQYEWETVKAEDGDFVLYADAQATVEALQAQLREGEAAYHNVGEYNDRLKQQVEALQRERDEAKKMEAVQKEVADNQTWHVRELRAALDAEREKVKGLEDEGVKLFEWRLALHSLTPGGSEFCTPDACEQWVRKSRASQHEYIIEQIKQRKSLQAELTQLQALVREKGVADGKTE